jgi:outer membrane protein TolC
MGSQGQNPLDYSGSDLDWSLGLDVDSTLDRRAERNSYRSSIIALRAAERAAMDLADSIRVSIRDALRQENTRRQAFEIQSEAVTLSLRRVDSSRLNLEAGNAQTRDLLESQAALVQAQNARTSALVDYRLAQLALLRDTDLLALDQDGFAILGIESSPSAGTSVEALVPGAPWGLAPAEEWNGETISAQADSGPRPAQG